MSTWEYKIIDSKHLAGGGAFKGKTLEVAEVYLNELGEAGWEIVGISFRELQRGYEFTGLAKRQRGA